MIKADYTLVRHFNTSDVAINLLTGSIDAVNSQFIKRMTEGQLDSGEEAYARTRGLLQDEEGEQRAIINKMYSQYAKNRDVPVSLFVPLSLECNLACAYCFQRNCKKSNAIAIEKRLERIQHAILTLKHTIWQSRRIIVVLYGGEPLLASNAKAVEELLEFCLQNQTPCSIITNGTTLHQYKELIARYRSILHRITITVDGSKRAHDKVRVFPNGTGSYNSIEKGLEELCDLGIEYVLRQNLTRENANRDCIQSLRRLGGKAEYHRVEYEDNDDALSFSSIMKLCLDGLIDMDSLSINPIVYFLRLVEKPGSIYPLFQNCAIGDVYLFSTDGFSICACSEAITDECRIGTYYPEIHMTEKEDNSTLQIPSRCLRCEVYPVCGGGCRLRGDGATKQSRCRMYGEILDMIDQYIERIL